MERGILHRSRQPVQSLIAAFGSSSHERQQTRMSRRRSRRSGARTHFPGQHGKGAMIVAVAAPVVLVLLALGIQAVRAAMYAPPPPGPVQATTIRQHSRGLPGITPRAGVVEANGARFTRADVVAFITTHPAILGSLPGKPAPVISSIGFLTAAQATALLHGESLGLPATAPVCVVQVTGSFLFTGGPPALPSTPYSRQTLVFDGQTGNLIITVA